MIKFDKLCACFFWAAAIAIPVSAQQVAGVTATQALLHYQAPSPAACQVRVSGNQSLSPLIADLDPALFTGADQDNRSGSVAAPGGTDRYFAVGKRRADLASDGKHYSRALQAF